MCKKKRKNAEKLPKLIDSESVKSYNDVAARKGDQPETAGGFMNYETYIATMADRS